MRKLVLLVLLSLVACAPGEDLTTGSVEQAAHWPDNGEGTDAVVMAGVLANTNLNRMFASHGLSEITTPPNLSQVNSYQYFDFYKVATMDTLSREALTYWASCALAPGHSMTIPQGYDSAGWPYGPSLTLNGSLGLCDQWGDYAPTEECLQSVSACMLARNNQSRNKVIFSQRGLTTNYQLQCVYGGGCFWKQLSIAVKAMLPVIGETSPGTPVSSSVACTSSMYGNRDCGWKPMYVAVGSPGASVTLSAVRSENSGDTMLRVCAGYQMCNSNAAIAFNDDTLSPYDLRPTVTFTVPSGGAGVYSLQWAPYSSSNTAATLNALTPTNATYPASELGVFSIKEGSFYGRIFLLPTESTGWNISYEPYGYCPTNHIGPYGGCRTKSGGNPGTTIVYPNMSVCTAAGWNDEYAYASKRVCAQGGCAAVHTGSCQYACSSFVTADQSWRGCYSNTGASWNYGITSSVHLPCDVVTGPECGWTLPPG